MSDEAVDIIVVDDDPLVGDLSRSLLEAAGYKVRWIEQGEELLAGLKKNPPKAVILDMMMPGIDGMELLRSIKSDPATKDIKVALVTAKSFPLERQRALKFGADLFIAKPFDVGTFVGAIAALWDAPAAPAAKAAAETAAPSAPASASALKVRVWGSRGFSPYLPNERSRYGRQTSCVSLETPHGIFILDAGSGIVPLGLSLAKNWDARRLPAKELWIMLTHFHLDHILGLGAFPCAHDPAFKISIASANDAGKDISELLQEIYSGPLTSFYPEPKAKIVGFRLGEGAYQPTPETRLETLYMRHPTTTLGFRIETGGKTIVYCPDNAIDLSEAGGFPRDDRLVRFCSNADLLIHDGRYTDEDYVRHKNQGHSGVSGVLELAAKANVKELVLFHLDPGYSDETLDAMLSKAQATVFAKKWSFRVHMASEGLSFEL